VDADPLISRDEVVSIMWSLADLVVAVKAIRTILGDEFGDEEAE
jgi:hypothetical protein